MEPDAQSAVIGDQVRHARRGRGWSRDELARALGLDRPAVEQIEAGTRRIDGLELLMLAERLEVPVHYLLQPPPAIVSRRADLLADEHTTDTDRHFHRIEVALSAWLADVRQLVEVGTLQPHAAVSYPSQLTSPTDAREAARWLRDQHDIGDQPITNVLKFCEENGQHVLATEIPGDGASLVDGDLAVAVVDYGSPPGRRRATAAHELGHLVLGDEYATDLGVHQSREERERLVQAFAAELLLPQRAFGLPPSSTDNDARRQLVALAATYRVSWSLALHQAEAAGWLDIDSRKRWTTSAPTNAEFNEALGWLPQPEDGRVPPRYAEAVMAAWHDDLITDHRAVEMLHGSITIDDLPSRDDADMAP